MALLSKKLFAGGKEEKKPGEVFDDKEVALFKEAFEAFQVYQRSNNKI